MIVKDKIKMVACTLYLRTVYKRTVISSHIQQEEEEDKIKAPMARILKNPTPLT